LLLNTGENHIVEGKHFFFEKQWCNMEGFLEKVEAKWVESRDKCPEEAYLLDRWHGCLTDLRRWLKGWGINIRGEYRRGRGELL
jgi:hypothetical protein